MEDIVTLIKGWELLKHWREKIKGNPPEKEALFTITGNWPAIAQTQLAELDTIIPEARNRAEEWLKCPGPISPRLVMEADGLTVFLAVVRIWETWLAISENSKKPNIEARWIASLPTEARRLLFRLRKQITLPTL